MTKQYTCFQNLWPFSMYLWLPNHSQAKKSTEHLLLASFRLFSHIMSKSNPILSYKSSCVSWLKDEHHNPESLPKTLDMPLVVPRASLFVTDPSFQLVTNLVHFTLDSSHANSHLACTYNLSLRTSHGLACLNHHTRASPLAFPSPASVPSHPTSKECTPACDDPLPQTLQPSVTEQQSPSHTTWLQTLRPPPLFRSEAMLTYLVPQMHLDP